jgi:hypothetical protein
MLAVDLHATPTSALRPAQPRGVARARPVARDARTRHHRSRPRESGDASAAPSSTGSAPPLPGYASLKGMECNLVDEDGAIDLPPQQLPFMDVVLLGIQPNTPTGLGAGAYTARLLAALARNPAVDVVTHLNDLATRSTFGPSPARPSPLAWPSSSTTPRPRSRARRTR